MKLLFKLFLSLLLVLQLFTFVLVNNENAEAISENLVIYQFQSGKAGAASEEFILLYNQSESDILVEDWCIQYASNTLPSGKTDVNFSDFVCINSAEPETELWVEAGGYIVFSSAVFASKQNEILAGSGIFTPDFVFSPGLVDKDRHLRLMDSNKNEIDRVGWGLAIRPEFSPAIMNVPGELVGRSTNLILDTDNNFNDFKPDVLPLLIQSGLYKKVTIVDQCLNIEDKDTIPAGYFQDELGNCYRDLCPNLEGIQQAIPEGYEKPEGLVDCILVPEVIIEDSTIFITEIFPNAPGSDTGQEFIEIYNPNKFAVNLAGYKIQVGPSFTKTYVLLESVIEPEKFLSYSDTTTKIVLPNTNGVLIRLVAPTGRIVSETDVYSEADDDVSWALVDDQWIYTNQITRDSANKPYLISALSEEEITESVSTVYAPCIAGKYRNPLTNRCRNIETTVSLLKACDEDEFRNPATNRCNKVSTSSTKSECAEGQERNPKTNRCRKISVLGSSTDDLPTISENIVETSSGSVNWGIISLALIGTFGYMVYEWREEIKHYYRNWRLQHA